MAMTAAAAAVRRFVWRSLTLDVGGFKLNRHRRMLAFIGVSRKKWYFEAFVYKIELKVKFGLMLALSASTVAVK